MDNAKDAKGLLTQLQQKYSEDITKKSGYMFLENTIFKITHPGNVVSPTNLIDSAIVYFERICSQGQVINALYYHWRMTGPDFMF